MRTQVIPLLAMAIVEAGILAAIPVSVIALGTRMINGLRDARVPWTPKIELAAFFAGAAAGAIVFFHSTPPDLLGPTAVFQVGGPWDMTFDQFLARTANPFDYDFSALLSVAGAVLFLVSGAIAIVPILWFGTPAAIANGARNIFLTLVGAFTAIYALGYCLWLLNRLNFWVFLLLMILVHMRSRTNRVVFKLN